MQSQLSMYTIQELNEMIRFYGLSPNNKQAMELVQDLKQELIKKQEVK